MGNHKQNQMKIFATGLLTFAAAAAEVKLVSWEGDKPT